MSGGLSLAIWMGGVALEIYRMVRADPVLDPPTPTDWLKARPMPARSRDDMRAKGPV